jgi:hypothetical protein
VEAQAIREACDALAAMPRTGPILATSLRVTVGGCESIVLHLESGKDVSVPRYVGETWADVIGRFNAGTEET